jgi:uncharacterized membrane protein (UPF0127 family)
VPLRVRVLTTLLVVAALLSACGGGGKGGGLHIVSSGPAGSPFAAFGETRLKLGDRCLRVLVAQTEGQRVQGLRDVRSLAPYDGMIFVYARDTNVRFTMANTPLPLDITFFDADGKPVDHTQMTPCPTGDDSTCPVYGSRPRFRYALERSAPASGGGALGTCA